MNSACLIVGSAIGIETVFNRMPTKEMKLPFDLNGANGIGV
jgi:hypothetical protein